MTKDNEDALRCADSGLTDRSTRWQQWKAEAVAHIRRLVAENEAKDALLRQAVQELEWAGYRGALVAAIRQHLDQKTT